MPGIKPEKTRAVQIAYGPHGPHGFGLFLSLKERKTPEKERNAGVLKKKENAAQKSHPRRFKFAKELDV